MFAYKTDPDGVDIDPACTRKITATGACTFHGTRRRSGAAQRRSGAAHRARRPTTLLRAGHDVVSLLYNFMDACLFEFATDDFVAKDMRVADVVMAPRAASGGLAADTGTASYSITVVACVGGDSGRWRAGERRPCLQIPQAHAPRTPPARCRSFGERFLLSKHLQGTEIKAITYSNLQIFTDGGLFTAGDEVQGARVATPDASAPAAEAGGAAADPHGDGAAAAAAVAPAAGAVTAGTGRRRAACDVYIIVDI